MNKSDVIKEMDDAVAISAGMILRMEGISHECAAIACTMILRYLRDRHSIAVEEIGALLDQITQERSIGAN